MLQNVTTIKVSAHCSDRCCVTLYDQTNREIYNNHGYVPSFLPNSYGDSLDLEIDIKTGKILNWPEITDDIINNTLDDIVKDIYDE